jgi:chromosome segregation ATPase
MPKTTQFNDEVPILVPKPVRQRKAAAKTKRNPLQALPLPPDVYVTDAVDSTLAGTAAEGLVARIYELENRLNQQAALLAERCAELDTLKADSGNIVSLQSRIREQDDLIQNKEIALIELEQSLETELRQAQNQLQVQKELLASHETELHHVKGLLHGQTAVALPNQNTIDRVTAESERLIAEQREARLALAKVEMDEWYTIRRRNSWNRLLTAMRAWFDKDPRDCGKSTMKEP